jgi:hypothetical protein
LTLLANSGCGGGSKSTPINEDLFCEQKAKAECQVTAKCGTVMMTPCVTERKTACLAVGAAVKAPRMFQAGNVPACVNQTNAVYAKALSSQATPTDLATMDDVCAYVYQGNSTTTCTVKYDCAGTKICDKKSCADKVIKNKGQLCANPGEVCNTGSYCAADPVSGNLTCLDKAAQGAACSATVPCLETLRCDGATGTCLARFTAGQSCGSSDDCVAAAPYCDQSIGCKCDLGLSFSAGGAACVDYGGGPTPTPVCSGSVSTDAGTGNTDAGTDVGADVATDVASGG